MSFEDEEESLEHTLLVVREVNVYKIPPRPTTGGYKCGEWLQTDKIWSGRLRVVSCKDRCEIRLEDPNSGELFAACFVLPGQRENSVESVLDSSRYFVLKIEDGRGKHAFVGLGFGERNEAFDFNVALSDHEKYVKRESEKYDGDDEASGDGHIDIHPAVNHRLKEGETIRINVKNKPSSGTGMLSAAVQSKTIAIAPPPCGANMIRSPLPPRQMIQLFLGRLLPLRVLHSRGQRKAQGNPVIHCPPSLNFRGAFLQPLDRGQVKPHLLDGQHFEILSLCLIRLR